MEGIIFILYLVASLSSYPSKTKANIEATDKTENTIDSTSTNSLGRQTNPLNPNLEHEDSKAPYSKRNRIIATDPSELKAAIQAARPNDLIILKNGIWQDAKINFNAQANASHPITIQSETAGQVILSGSSKIIMSQPHLIIDGLLFKNGSIKKGSVIRMDADNCKVLNTAIVDYNPLDFKTEYFWIRIKGSHNTIENCFFKGKNNNKPLIINYDDSARHNVIRSCYFKDIPLIPKNNGREIIRIIGYGHSDQSGDDGAYCTIENNLFENADGEGVEIISLKSNHNTVKNNTVRSSCGGLVSRRGSNNVFENNIILGEHKQRTLGIRIANKHNTVFNNYIANVAHSGIIVMSGEFIDSSLTKDHNTSKRMKNGPIVREPIYSAVKYCTFRNNTIINAKTYGIDIGRAYKKNWSEQQIVLIPEENSIQNNLIINPKYEAIYIVKQDKQYPLNKFVFKPNLIESNLILANTNTLSTKNGFLIPKKKRLNVGVDHRMLRILGPTDVGPDWMH